MTEPVAGQIVMQHMQQTAINAATPMVVNLFRVIVTAIVTVMFVIATITTVIVTVHVIVHVIAVNLSN